MNLTLGNSKSGKAVFSNIRLRKGDKIIRFTGNIYIGQQLPEPYSSVEDHYVQIGENLYMGPSGNLDDLINHSCNPNSWLKIQEEVWLIALRDIERDEEITWDYSTTMHDDSWEMECNCGSDNCRKTIKEFKLLPDEIRTKYAQLGIVPDYVR